MVECSKTNVDTHASVLKGRERLHKVSDLPNYLQRKYSSSFVNVDTSHVYVFVMYRR